MKYYKVLLKNIKEDNITEVSKRVENPYRYETLDDEYFEVLNRDLKRYYELLKFTMNTILERLTIEELHAFLDMMNGVFFREGALYNFRVIYSNIINGYRSGKLNDKDIDIVLSKLNELTHLEQIALIDFTEQFRKLEKSLPLENFIEYYFK